MQEQVQRTYLCDLCNAPPFEDRDEAREHEAAHYGLTVAEYLRWGQLNIVAERAGYRVGWTNNAETREAFDKAVEELCDFEREHKVTEAVKPQRFLM